MAAPTGKAAQRLKESVIAAKASLAQQGSVSAETLEAIPETASTLHRLLGVIRGSNGFRHHQGNPLELDLLLLDEVSMIDLPLMARLVRALPPQARLIMLGDADQLPSVAAGSVLADLAPLPHPGYSVANTQHLKALTGVELPAVDAAMDHLCVLEKSHRFSGGGGIGTLAKQVIGGAAEASWQALVQGTEQTHRVTGEGFQAWLAGLAEEYYRPVLQAQGIEQAFTALARFRFLAATRVGPLGIEQLNSEIEGALRKRGAITGSGPFYPGRPVMVTENHYELGLFNGDIGLVWPHASGRLQAAFEDAEQRLRWFTLGRLPAVETVFAMTIHKTQGSEFDHVALVLPDQETPLLSRELVYTGITRARQQLTVWADEPVWRAGVERRIQRYSGLAARLFKAY
jgi:exodeoxyribonuclease V alpha subunit